jgi:pimeloyl-ACP methyl ester carboxylesterase
MLPTAFLGSLVAVLVEACVRCEEAIVSGNDRERGSVTKVVEAPFESRAALVEGEILLRGSRLRFAEAGPTTAATIVLLHGTAFDLHQWSAIAPLLARDFRVIAIDAPGHGASEAAAGGAEAIGAYASATLDLISALGVGRVAIVAHSLGAAAAVRIAIDRPEFVARLVLVSLLTHLARASWSERVTRSPIFAASLPLRWLRARALRPHRGDVASATRGAWSDRLPSLLDDDATARASMRALADLRADRMLEAHLPRLRTPTALVFGRHDPLVHPGLPQRLARQANAERLHLLDCGHVPEQTAPRELAETIRAFLEPAPRSPPSTRVTRAPRVGSSE